MKKYRFLFAGGGTGGHLFPGLAFAEYLKEVYPDSEIMFVGTKKGIEAQKVPQAGFRVEFIDIGGIKGTGKKNVIKNLLKIPKAIARSKDILSSFYPDAVIGLGGYASGPALIAAWLERYPTFIFEQNSVPGLTNRVLGRIVNNIFTTFEYSHKYFPKEKVVFSSNPVRKAIREMKITENEKGIERILIFGGSQGAQRINEIAAKAAPELKDFKILHQTGRYSYDKTKEIYAQTCKELKNITLVTFIENMAHAYNDADLIICRAGATTISELKIVKKPAILIPFPRATDNHQVLNAMELVRQNAALMIEEKELTPEVLVKTIKDLAQNQEKYQKIKDSLKKLSKIDTEKIILSKILEYIDK